MLPNRFPDAGETPEYNMVDATLLFFEAARAFLVYIGGLEFVRNELFPVFADIIPWHVRGTRYGIKVDSSEVPSCGEPGAQLRSAALPSRRGAAPQRNRSSAASQGLRARSMCRQKEFSKICNCYDIITS